MAAHKLRVATLDTAHAFDIACSEVESAIGLPVRAEFQEIEGGSLILELRLGDEAVHSPSPSRLASTVDRAASNVEVLSSWKESAGHDVPLRRCPEVRGVGYEPLPHVAQRAFDDDVPTAQWDRADSSWHLAVPSLCGGQPIVGLSGRRGYSHRFSARDAAGFRRGLGS